jgi:hypothetical protein
MNLAKLRENGGYRNNFGKNGMGRKPAFDWGTLKQVYVQGEMNWESLSSEANNNTPNRPKRDSLYRKYKQEHWEQLRDAYRGNAPEGGLFDPEDSAKIKAALLLPPGGAIAEVIDQYSADLPENLQERYRQATTDPDLYAMRRDIAVINSLISNCLHRMEKGESGDLWGKVKKQAREVMDNQGDPIKAKASLTQLMKMISRGSPFVELQKELLMLMKERANLIEKETNRLEKLQQYASRQDVHSLIQQVGEIIKTRVENPDTLRLIGQDIRKLRLN